MTNINIILLQSNLKLITGPISAAFTIMVSATGIPDILIDVITMGAITAYC